ncbi:hypothetical protein [Mycobacteroides abscessus]|uniref:hypothetical protein n=1 Tax=Mycobacteroides abscessus TaxID=36809 RepID=UPI001300084D|nr:hypothetical protein [Mycobacteroides abscessus]
MGGVQVAANAADDAPVGTNRKRGARVICLSRNLAGAIGPRYALSDSYLIGT